MTAKRTTRPEMSWIEKRQQWRKRVTINGKSYDVYGKTKEEAREKVKDLQRQAVAGVPLGRNTTFYQYTAEWLKAKVAGIRPNSANLYCIMVDM